MPKSNRLGSSFKFWKSSSDGLLCKVSLSISLCTTNRLYRSRSGCDRPQLTAGHCYITHSPTPTIKRSYQLEVSNYSLHLTFHPHSPPATMPRNPHHPHHPLRSLCHPLHPRRHQMVDGKISLRAPSATTYHPLLPRSPQLKSPRLPNTIYLAQHRQEQHLSSAITLEAAGNGPTVTSTSALQ